MLLNYKRNLDFVKFSITINNNSGGIRENIKGCVMTIIEKELQITEQELIYALEYCRPITINGQEYAEPKIVSEFCDNIPFVEIPTYKMTNFDTNQVLYLSYNKGKVSVSQLNGNGLKCGVCEFRKTPEHKYYNCLAANHKNSRDYLRQLTQVKNLKER